MQLFLINYDTHYEIEQLSRMFFRGLTVEKLAEKPELPQQDYILIEKTDTEQECSGYWKPVKQTAAQYNT